jgi:hypothetical protein
MARFCGTCGNPLNEASAFCGACGARVAQAAVAPAATPVPPFSPVPPVPLVSPLPPVQTGSSPVVKIILVVVLVLVVLGTLSVAGMFYALHLASRKAHEFSRQVRDTALSSLAADNAGGSNVSAGQPGPGACRFLSKEDVGRAIGVVIVATKTTVGGCEYLAQGTAGDMTAKHIAALMASKGATAQQQQMFQTLSRGLLSGAQTQEDGSSPPVSTVVMAFTIDPNSAKTQMSTNENGLVLDAVGPSAKPLTGIGDEAFDASGSIMMVRKGDKLIHITYSTCPCTIDAIKPLAQRLAASL